MERGKKEKGVSSLEATAIAQYKMMAEIGFVVMETENSQRRDNIFCQLSQHDLLMDWKGIGRVKTPEEDSWVL